jgi:hypothetical protein
VEEVLEEKEVHLELQVVWLKHWQSAEKQSTERALICTFIAVFL